MTEDVQDRVIPTNMPLPFLFADNTNAGSDCFDLVTGDPELEQELLPLGVGFCLKEEREGVRVGAVLQDRRKVGGDLAPESVLPAVAGEVVEQDRGGRCRVLEEDILVGALAQGDGEGTAFDGLTLTLD